jgi:hypothetical protein
MVAWRRCASAVRTNQFYKHRFQLLHPPLTQRAGQMDGADLASAFSRGLGRKIKFVSLPLDEFEQGVDAALGDGVGKGVSVIFRFLQSHPEDRDFVSRPFTSIRGLEDFQPIAVDAWVNRTGQ